MKYCIIGAGPTGLGAAYRLTQFGETDFQVLERAGHVGGLAASFQDKAGWTWDMGVHVLHSYYNYIDELTESLLPGGKRQYNDFEDMIVGSMGRGITDHFMLPYNRKIWNMPPSEMGCQWLEDRVPVPDNRRVIHNTIMQEDDVSWGPNAMFNYPATGGIGTIFEALAARLPQENVRLNCEVGAIDPHAKTVTLEDGTHESYEHLISTMPIDILCERCNLETETKIAGRLRHTHVTVVCIGLPRPMPKLLREKSWLYLPGDEPYYRLTMHSQFSDDHTPDPETNCSFMAEISCDVDNKPSDTELSDGCLEALARVVDFDPADAHVMVLNAPYGYPVPTHDRDDLLKQIQPRLEALDIYSRGRFGAWKYEVGNMDHSLMQGVELVNRLLGDVPEATLHRPPKMPDRVPPTQERVAEPKRHE